MGIEVCQNCERQIGKLEQAYIHKGNIVCEQCNEMLQGQTSLSGHHKTDKATTSRATDPEESTHNQLEYAKQLGIKIPQSVTKWELSELISEAVEERGIKKVRTIEKTGKSYKAGMLVGIIGMIIGILIACGGQIGWGLFFIVFGFVTFWVYKIGAWWMHG